MINKIIEEYTPNAINDTDDAYTLKEWITNNLTLQEQRVLILYADLQSYRKVAKLLNCSQGTVNNYIKRIRNKIQDEYYK